MSVVAKIDADGSGEIEIVVEGYGGSYDDAGDLAQFSFTVPVSPTDAYVLARQLCAAANLKRERSGYKHHPGPFVVASAVKRAPPDEAMKVAMKLVKESLAKESPDQELPRNRMVAWQVPIPDYPEARAIFGEVIMIDNLGGVMFPARAPSRLGIQVNHRDLMMDDGYGVDVGEVVRLEVRPLR